MKIDQIAQNVYLAGRHLLGTEEWDKLSAWDRYIHISLARACEIRKLEDSAVQVHTYWRASRKADGWNFGPEWNGPQKECPLLASYDDLLSEQQQYIQLCYAMVRVLAP